MNFKNLLICFFLVSFLSLALAENDFNPLCEPTAPTSFIPTTGIFDQYMITEVTGSTFPTGCNASWCYQIGENWKDTEREISCLWIEANGYIPAIFGWRDFSELYDPEGDGYSVIDTSAAPSGTGYDAEARACYGFYPVNEEECQTDSDCSYLGEGGNCYRRLRTYEYGKCSYILCSEYFNPLGTITIDHSIASTCNDGILNGNETDIDCGGNCPSCENGKSCLENQDCESGYCNPDKVCAVERDLYIEWIKPVQVVEDVPLVAGKETVVRVKVVNDDPDVDTSVKINYNGWISEQSVHINAFDFEIVDFYPPNQYTN